MSRHQAQASNTDGSSFDPLVSRVLHLTGGQLLTALVLLSILLLGLFASTATPAQAVSTTLVISEFRTRGPNGAGDEFIELHNLSASPVDIGGWRISGSNNIGTVAVRATIPTNTILNTGCRYLVVNSTGYSGAVAGNLVYNTGVTDDGGIALANASNVIIDAVGMSSGSAYKEGTTLTPLSANVNQSYERKPVDGNNQDTDDNATDFQLNAGSSNPQNSESVE